MAAMNWVFPHGPATSPYFRDADRVLIAGNAVVITRQETLFGAVGKPVEVNGPPGYYTPDRAGARWSVRRLAQLHPAVAATGQGVPVGGATLRDGQVRVARAFDTAARPARGWYVRTPGSGERGGRHLRPAVGDGLGAAARRPGGRVRDGLLLGEGKEE
jgi:hypothetical protein